MLLEQLRYVPEKGYHCGCEGMVRILLKGKNFDRFKTNLADADRDTKALVKKILEGMTDKRTADKRGELTIWICCNNVSTIKPPLALPLYRRR